MEAAPEVVVTSRSFGKGDFDASGRLRAAGATVVHADPGHDVDRLRDALARAVAWIAGAAPVTEAHLQAAPRLRLLARYGTGYDAVDLSAAARRGITVTHVPGANAAAVADHTLALTLAALRHVVEGDAAVRRGDWSAVRGRELGSLTVGLLGFGHVGREVARRFRGFGSRVLVSDPAAETAECRSADVELVDVDALVPTVDVLSLHVPGGRRILDAGAVKRLRRGAVVVNTARADVVDERALANALLSGHLGSVASDVIDMATTTSPMLTAPRTVLTPHCAGLTVESIDRMGRATTEEVRRLLRGEPPHHPLRRPIAVDAPSSGEAPR